MGCGRATRPTRSPRRGYSRRATSAIAPAIPCPHCGEPIDPGVELCPSCGKAPSSEPTVIRDTATPASREVLEGKWAIERKLGQGGMGTVYLAHDLELDRKVAVKMMAGSFAHEPEVVARFEREARMMARLDHPNLVPVYAVGRKGDVPYIVMKFLEGCHLGEYARSRGRVHPAELVGIARQVCAGLQFVHQRGVVHRDIKPANLFISPEGHVTMLDLGVAHDTQSQMTRSGVMVGTPRYMAPEQVLGRKVDHRADLYSLATVLYEMATGKPVFEGPSDFAVMRAHIDENPVDPVQLAPLPRSFADVLLKGLSKDPEQRFDSAQAFCDALELASADAVEEVPLHADAQAPVHPPPVRAPSGRTPLPGRAPSGRTPLPGKAPSGKTPLPGKAPSGKTPLPGRTPSGQTPMPGRTPLPGKHPSGITQRPKSTPGQPVPSGLGPRGPKSTPGQPVPSGLGPRGPKSTPGQPVPGELKGRSPRASIPRELVETVPMGADVPPASETAAVAPNRTLLYAGVGVGVLALVAVVLVVLTWRSEPAGDGPKVEPTKVEPMKVEPMKGEPTKGEPTNAEPDKQEPVKGEPPKVEPDKQEPVQDEPTKAVPDKREPTRGEGPRRPRGGESKKPGVVNVVTLAGGESVPAFVDVDGIRKGSTPIRLTLEPGKHELVFRQQGYATVTKSLTVTAGETTKLKVELKP